MFCRSQTSWRQKLGRKLPVGLLCAIAVVWATSPAANCFAQRLPTPGSVAAGGAANAGQSKPAAKSNGNSTSEEQEEARAKARTMSPFYAIGKIAPKRSGSSPSGPGAISSSIWRTGTLIGPRHVLTATTGMVAILDGANGVDDILFELPHLNMRCEIEDAIPLQDSNIMIVLLKATSAAALRKSLSAKIHGSLQLPVLAHANEGYDATREGNNEVVRATGYDMPSGRIGAPGVSISGLSGALIHRRGGIKTATLGMTTGFLQGALKGHNYSTSDDGPFDFGGLLLPRDKRNKRKTSGINAAIGTFGGGVLGMLGGALSDQGYFESSFTWNDGATGGPVWLDESPPKIIGIMSMTRSPEFDSLGGIQTKLKLAHLVEAIQAPAAKAIDEYIRSNP